IRDRLAGRKAADAARELAQKVVTDLNAVSRNYPNEPLPLAQMARRHGLLYQVARTARGRELLSREELEGAVPQGLEVAAFAFERGTHLYDPRLFDVGEVPLICQVLERRSEEPRPLDEVEDEVRRDCLRESGLERAVTFAEKLKERAAEVGLEAAVEEMNERLGDLLGSAEAGAGAEPAEGPALRVQESDFFARSDRTIPGLAQPHPAVVEAAFQLGPDELGVAAEGPPVSRAYVIQAVEREDASEEGFVEDGPIFRFSYLVQKQRRAVQDWMAGLLDAAQRARRLGE
ncbi:MAG: hypothetical protein KAX19_05610, partial [Candidatus Brocadiae bacterium]|nr:hypothetical protein [Candidatus Brocadiia bacterium]